jgi:chemotaxis protein methyltransferase CheR
MVTFSYLNLVEDSYPSLPTNTQAMDLILCRNVMIYFNEATNRVVVERLYRSLSKKGWLVVGHTEPSQALFHRFAVTNFPGTVIYQKTLLKDTQPVLSERFNPPIETAAAEPLQASLISKAKPRPTPRVSTPAPVARLIRLPLPPPDEVQSALALCETGCFEEAMEQLETLAARNPQDIWPPYLLAKTYANRLELEKAEHWIDIVLMRESLLAPAHYLRGLILQEAGRSEASLEAFRSCVYADHQFVLGHFALAGGMARLGQPKRALKTYENVEDLLGDKGRDDPIPEGDGMTVGRLLKFVSAQKELIRP